MQALADRFGLASLDPPWLPHVVIIAIAAVALDYFIYAFTKTREWVSRHEVEQESLLKGADIIARQGAVIAFPTRTLHLENTAETP